MQWEIEGTTMSHFIGTELGQQSRIAIDSTKSPKQLTLTVLKGPKEEIGLKSECIFEWNGDKLRICIATGGQPAPTEFAVKKQTVYGLLDLERIPEGIRELKDLAGEWKYSAVQEGKELSTGTIDIYRDVIWITLGDKVEKAIVSLDADIGFFDITPITGPIALQSKPLLGRFTWKDGELTVYSGLPGAERPAEAKTGKGVTVAVMVRAVKK